VLEVTSLRKTFSSVVAVDDVSLSVRSGEILGLLGPNGAGKTTTIRLILDIIKPESGEIRLNGETVSRETLDDFGYLPEERGLYRKSKLLTTILYFASLKGLDPSEARRRAAQWLKRFDLTFYSDRKVEELSKGNQQKVQFIIAVLHNPSVLILDEPFSGLDPVNQIILKDELSKMRNDGKAIVFSTHMMEQAEKLCDRICLINKGKVVLYGDVGEIKRDHGTNTIHLEFEGDGSFLRSLPSVKKSLVQKNSAEIELQDGVNPSDMIKNVAGRLAMKKFELREPSLETIFLEKVGAPRNAGLRRENETSHSTVLENAEVAS
jgi:ABC-2 type transport system ATP-binding protein